MGKELAGMAGLAPEPLPENNDPDHGAAVDDLDGESILGSAFEEDDPAPGAETTPEDGNEDTPGKEPEKPDDDAADDAGQKGEEQDPDDDPDEDPDKDADEEGDEPETPPTDSDQLEDVPEEKYTEAQSNYQSDLQRAKDDLKAKAEPIYNQIVTQRKAAKARIEEIEKSARDEDGVEVPLSLEADRELRRLEAAVQKLDENEQTLISRAKQIMLENQAELTIQHNMRLWPQLKSYEKEYRHCVTSGMDCSDPQFVYNVCRSLRQREAGPEPQRPKVTKQDIERQALQENIDRKQRAKVSAGAKSSGATAKASKALPKAAQRDLDDITRYFNGGDEE